MVKASDIMESGITYEKVDDRGLVNLMNATRNGVAYNTFNRFFKTTPLTLEEWAGILHVSDRTLQRYREEKRTFDASHSERIMQVILLFHLGKEVFGTEEKFHKWLESDNIALGKVKPKSLLDNVFGIQLLKDELIRIEHGVMA